MVSPLRSNRESLSQCLLRAAGQYERQSDSIRRTCSDLLGLEFTSFDFELQLPDQVRDGGLQTAVP